MLSDNVHCSLLEKLDAEQDKWWSSYVDALADDELLVFADAQELAIAYLVESGCLAYEDVAKATQALARCSEWGIGKAAYIERVMKDADKVRAKGGF